MTRRVTRWASAATVVVVFLLATYFSATTDEPSSAFVEAGRGASPLVTDAKEQGLETLRLLSGPSALGTDPDHDPARTLLVVAAPERAYDAAEAGAVREFLNQGGRLLVVDFVGQGNSLTSPLGLTFERVRLVTPDGIAQITASMGARDLALSIDQPTAIRAGPGLDHEVLATAPAGSFLDRDGDGVIGAGDPVGSFPVAAAVEVGVEGGRLVVVAGVAPFFEQAADEADNAEFRRMLLQQLLPDGGRVIIDESRTPTRDPWLLAAATVAGALASGPGRYVAITLGLVVLAAATLLATQAAWSRHRFYADRFVRRSALVAARPSAAGRPTGLRGAATQWSTRGRAAVSGGLVLALAGTMLGNRQATTAGALLLLAGALALWTRPLRVGARRRVSTAQIPEDGTVHVDVELTASKRRRGLVEVRDDLPHEFRLAEGQHWFRAHVSPGGPVASRYTVKPAVRGPYRVGPLRVRRSDPFHLRAVQFEAHAAQEILVHPRHEPLSRIPFKSKVAALTLGPHLVNRAGDGAEFHALRDYEYGDSIRSINWKASARSSNFIVNQRVHESMSTITIFLDARAISAAGSVRSSPINASCRAALTVASGAVQARDRVRVFAYGDGVTDLAPGKGADQIHDLTNALAGLEAKGSMPFAEAVEAVLPSLRPRTPCILISGFEEDDTVVEGVRQLHQRDVIPTVLAMPIGTDPGAGEPLEPDAERLHDKHQGTIAALRGQSVSVVPITPHMPLQLALRLEGA